MICEDGKYPEYSEYETLELLIEKLQQLEEANSPAMLYMFTGSRLLLSKGPKRHLLLPDREPVPLFDSAAVLSPDPSQSFAGDPPPADDEDEEEADDATETDTSSQSAIGPKVPDSEAEWGDWGSSNQ